MNRQGRAAAALGLIGPGLLAAYFAAPAFLDWPYAGLPPIQLAQYALTHQQFFFAGAWLQVTGATLSVLFFVSLVDCAGAFLRPSGAAVILASALLLAVVVVEAAFLVAVPVAAGDNDLATVATSFAFSNGVFARVFPLAPAPLVFLSLGAVLRDSTVLPRAFVWTAFLIAGLFETASIVAIFAAVGSYAAIALSVLQEFWIVGAAVARLRIASTEMAQQSPSPV